MIEGVMNRSHWNRSRKSNIGFLLPTQGCRQSVDAARITDSVLCASLDRARRVARSPWAHTKHCTAASRWSIEGSPTCVVNAGLNGAHECLVVAPERPATVRVLRELR